MAEENDIENLNANLSTVSEELSLKGNKPRRKKDSLTEEQEHLFIKLFDHCNLAIAQRRIYRKTEEDLNQVINDAKDALTKNVKTATEKVNNIEKNLTGQLVGLISIFTALSFVVFGGMTILDSILDNIRTAPISRLICTGILWAICMSLLFMCFMKFILKIIHPERDPVFGNKFMIPYWIFIGVLSAILIVFVILSLRRPLFFTNI